MSDGAADALVRAGISAAEAQRKETLFANVQKHFAEKFQSDPLAAARWFVPGRIEIFGKHTDYAGGRSLVCAVERGICVVSAARADDAVRIADVSSGSSMEFSLELEVTPRWGWEIYPATVARRFVRNFPRAHRGADIAFASDLPRSAGLSSSSALMIAIFQTLAAANAIEEMPEYRENIRTKEDLAAYLACVENGNDFRGLSGDSGVGTAGGSEDHTAILLARAGRLAQYQFCPMVMEHEVEFPGSHTFVIASSGVTASKTGEAKEAYNRISETARRILAIWNAVSGRNDATLREAVRSSADAPERIRTALRESGDADFSAGQLTGRFEQFLLESETVVPNAANAFAKCDWSALGELSSASQTAAEKLLGNQIAETSALVRMARERGAVAASAFGAGFGGSVWGLVRKGDAESFRDEWRAEYRRAFPNAAPRSEFFVSGAGPGMMRVSSTKIKGVGTTDEH